MTDNEIKKLWPQCVALGRIYRVLSDAMDQPASEGKLLNACMYPIRENAQITMWAFQSNKITAKENNIISRLLDKVELSDWEQFLDSPVPIALQGAWSIGYILGDEKPALVKMRKKAGLTQTELAEKIGTTQSIIARWETKKATPSAENIKLLCKALECSKDDLVDDFKFEN